MNSDILKMAAPRLSTCCAIIEAIAAHVDAHPMVSHETVALQLVACAGRISEVALQARSRGLQAAAAATLFEERVRMFVLSAGLQLRVGPDNEDYVEPLRAMLAHQLVDYVDATDRLFMGGWTTTRAVGAVVWRLGVCMDQVEYNGGVIRSDSLVYLHQSVMRLLVNSDERAADGKGTDQEWVDANLVRVLQTVRKMLAGELGAEAVQGRVDAAQPPCVLDNGRLGDCEEA